VSKSKDVVDDTFDRMFRLREVAERLNVSIATVSTLVREGELKGPKIRSRQRIFESSYNDYVRRMSGL
jgi:excisionase family DNA binding protein